MADLKNRLDEMHISKSTSFGHEMLQHFLLDEKYTNLNHGSFGTYPKPVREALHHFQSLAEARPDPFIRYHYPLLLKQSRQALAQLLNVPTDEVVFVPNATTGVNTVLRSLVFKEKVNDDEDGEAKTRNGIVYFSTTYGACQRTVEYICEIQSAARAVKIELDYPIGDDQLVEKFRDVLRREGGRVKVALLDTVVSMPGVRMPFERLVEICRQEGVLSLVDGAHGVGHVHLDLAKLDADFFVSNCHKWLYVPRGCAVFHVPIRNQVLIRSALPTSHGFIPMPSPATATINGGKKKKKVINPLPASTNSAFVTLFDFVGTIDASPYLCIPAALKFRQEICGGEEEIRKYCFELARQGGELVAGILDTEVMRPSSSDYPHRDDDDDDDDHKDNQNDDKRTKDEKKWDCCFANVRLPLIFPPSSSSSSPPPDQANKEEEEEEEEEIDTGPQRAQQIMRLLTDHHDTFVAIVFHAGACWARLSAQIYLDLDDFRRVGLVLKKVCLS